VGLMTASRCRIVIRGMNPANRGPGAITAVINDPTNLGVSTYYSSPGELYFTLRINHPQAGAVEPWRTHYCVEEYVSGAWKPKFYGLMVDFDANENDIVFYGMDYLGLLDRVIDTRYVEGKPDTPPPTGSKFVDTAVSSVISNLLAYARDKANSPVGFIYLGARDSFPEKVTIYSTFTAIGAFLQGLVETHRQGTGRRSRLWVESLDHDSHRWRLADKPGVDRKGIRLTYGGLVQGFNIIGFGQFGTKAHGIGRAQLGTKLFYRSATSPGLSQTTWGSIEVVDFHDNVTDANDLTRRVKQHATSAGRVGKRIAMGIKVDGIRPFDGYNIADCIVVAIKRGVIDTMRYGSGLWMVVGTEWRVFPDGHDEVTLVVLPKEDGVAPNPDLLVAQEVLPAPIGVDEIADGAITTEKIASGAVTADALAPDAVGNEHVQDGAILGAQVGEGVITADKINESGLPADLLTSGVISIGTEEGVPDVLVVYDSDTNEIGRWGSEGLLISDALNPSYLMRLTHSVLEFSSDGGVTWTTAISASGINADAIRFGAASGGHNRMPNSGFEMAAFSAPLSKTWTVAADWGTTIGTDVNIIKSGDDLKITVA